MMEAKNGARRINVLEEKARYFTRDILNEGRRFYKLLRNRPLHVKHTV